LILISKNEFLEMFELKVFSNSRSKEKQWTVTSRQKPSRRKKHYVSEEDYEKYMFRKNNKNNNINPS